MVLGGTSLMGGRGTMVGTVLGALTIAVIGNGLILAHISPFFTQIVTGAIILIAIWLNTRMFSVRSACGAERMDRMLDDATGRQRASIGVAIRPGDDRAGPDSGRRAGRDADARAHLSTTAAAGGPAARAGAPAFAEQPVNIEILGELRMDPFVNRDNCALDDEPTRDRGARRLRRRRAAHTVVDPTCRGIGRDPRALARIAGATGLQIVMGAGYYSSTSHPDWREGDERRRDRRRDHRQRVGGGVDGSRTSWSA